MKKVNDLLSATSFDQYFLALFKNEVEVEFIQFLLRKTNIYVFGGIVRDYFLNKMEHRDIDLVLGNLDNDTISYLKKYKLNTNQFGGYKIQVNDKTIDLWAIERTWSFVMSPQMDFELFKAIPSTSFFNLTAIIFDFSEKHFYFASDFITSIKQKRIEITNEMNPFPELCIVKSYEYYKNFNFQIGYKLKRYIIKYFHLELNKLEIIQLRHYGEIKYSLDELVNFYKNLIKIKPPTKRVVHVDQLALTF